MLALGSLAFASPWLLAALAALPVIWWLLRVTPPAPRRIAFPAIRLLLGLVPREETPARTPWGVILLRTVIATVVIDDGWAAARDWSRRQAALLGILSEAEREDRPVVVVTTAPLASGEPA